MDGTMIQTTRFPADLVEWAGHHAGGVKRLFDDSGGRPAKSLLRTNLINMLERWAEDVATGVPSTPRILLLVGGPGNGKTEAIEHTVRRMDHGLGSGNKLVEVVSKAFHPLPGKVVPRVVSVEAGATAAIERSLFLDIVQDASVTAGHASLSAASLLIEELKRSITGASSHVYLCCVNRGVLDDALIEALDSADVQAREILEEITRAVSLSSDAPQCWPLATFPMVAVWPMDAETLLDKPDANSPSPAQALLEYATTPTYWQPSGTCPAGDLCPFCNSQALLARGELRDALLQILRWYELASGKRWSFRDLFSLISYLLSGHRSDARGKQTDPCSWAAGLIELDKACKLSRAPRKQELTAAFYLATSGYQHALFHRWDKDAATVLRSDLKDLDLNKDSEEARTLLGMQHFLHERRTSYLPTSIEPLLESLAELLDPALANPETEVSVSSKSNVLLGELDIRISKSLQGGIDFVKKYQVLSKSELELLRRLAKADQVLSQPLVRRKKPTAANRIQRLLRDFACRFVRRSICTRVAVVADESILRSFQNVAEDAKGQGLYEVARQVKNLLNSREGFEVSLTTTFGQPLPPTQRQSTLVVQPRTVSPRPQQSQGRPKSPISFLRVGSGKSAQPIALTYDLFKAIKELERGLSPASLPLTVVALLDTTKARLSGPIVRDPEVLEDARIRLGADGIEIGLAFTGFVAMSAKD